MKFKVENVKEFKKAVALVKQLIPRKPVKPILGGLYLKGRKEGLSIIANVLNSWIDVCLPLTVEPWDSEMVFDSDIFKIIQNIKQPFEFDNGVIKQGQLQLEPLQLNTDDYPPLYNLTYPDSSVYDVNNIQDSLKFVIPSASTDEYMKNLNCVNWHFKDTELAIVAADGFQLAMSVVDVKGTPKQYLMDLAAMKVLAKFPRMLWTITPGENGILFSCGDVRMMVRQPDWDYPNYEKILPTIFSAESVIDRDTFLEALGIFSNQEAIHIKQDDTFTISNFDTERRQIIPPTAVVSIKEKTGEIEAALNTKFLQGILKTFEEGDVHISWTDDKGPVQLQQRSGSIKILMPVRIR